MKEGKEVKEEKEVQEVQEVKERREGSGMKWKKKRRNDHRFQLRGKAAVDKQQVSGPVCTWRGVGVKTKKNGHIEHEMFLNAQ